jgi:predicted transcriptional regulator
MAKLKKTFLCLFGLLVALSSLFICIVTIDILLEKNTSEEAVYGCWYFLWTMPFVGLAGFLLAYRSRPRRRQSAPLEHIRLVISLLKSKGGRLSTTDIFASVNLAKDEAHSVLDALANAKEGQFIENELGVQLFELRPNADNRNNRIKEAIKRLIIGSSKIRMAGSFFFIVACMAILITGSDEGCGGYEGYCIIVFISSAVILSTSYTISYLKKRRRT